VITRSQVAKAALWQLLFVLRGTSCERVRAASEEGLMLLRGFTPGQMQELVAESLEPVLKPLVYDEPLALVARHRERGEPSYIVSAALQEVVDVVARDLASTERSGRSARSKTVPTRAAASARCTGLTRRRPFESSPRARRTTSMRRRRTRTATPTCRSSKWSATPWR
jgi:hypothetical protein